MVTKNISEPVATKLSDDLLLRTVVDDEFRKELLTNPEILGDVLDITTPLNLEEIPYDARLELQFPYLVEQPDIAFAQLLEDIVNDISAQANSASNDCRCTCVSTLTWKCDGCSF